MYAFVLTFGHAGCWIFARAQSSGPNTHIIFYLVVENTKSGANLLFSRSDHNCFSKMYLITEEITKQVIEGLQDFGETRDI